MPADGNEKRYFVQGVRYMEGAVCSLHSECMEAICLPFSQSVQVERSGVLIWQAIIHLILEI